MEYEEFEIQENDRPVQERQQSPFANSPYVSYQFDQGYTAKPAKKKKKSGKFFKGFLSVVLILVLVFGSCLATAYYMNWHWSQKTAQQQASVEKSVADLKKQLETYKGMNSTGTADNGGAEGYLSAAQVYAQNVDSVVAVSNQAVTTNFFGQVSETASSGSGFIISKDGYVVSNYHVVAGATSLSVITSDGVEYDAELVGFDETNDISVLKIDGQDLPCVTFGSSDALVVGDQVAAIGNPLGELTSTLTMGYISAKERSVNTDDTVMTMLQTDAAINSGNSGGPLFNMKGQVIGITTAKYSGTSSSGATIEGIGFAIPIDDVADIIADLSEFGQVKSGYLGVMVQDVPAATAQQYGLPMGALVVEVTEGSCADTAGVMQKDIIVKLGDETVTCLADLSRALRGYEGGEETQITVYRGGAEKTMKIVLDTSLPTQQEQQVEQTQPQTQFLPDNFWFNPFG